MHRRTLLKTSSGILGFLAGCSSVQERKTPPFDSPTGETPTVTVTHTSSTVSPTATDTSTLRETPSETTETPTQTPTEIPTPSPTPTPTPPNPERVECPGDSADYSWQKESGTVTFDVWIKNDTENRYKDVSVSGVFSSCPPCTYQEPACDQPCRGRTPGKSYDLGPGEVVTTTFEMEFTDQVNTCSIGVTINSSTEDRNYEAIDGIEKGAKQAISKEDYESYDFYVCRGTTEGVRAVIHEPSSGGPDVDADASK